MKHPRTSGSPIPVPAHRKGKERTRRLRSNSSLPLVHLPRFRQGAYRFFSAILLYPEVERLKAALEAAMELDFESKHQAGFAFFDRWQPLVSVLTSAGMRDLRRMQQEYSEVFVAKRGGIPCYPSESVYLGQQGHTAGVILARLEQEYAAAGLSLSPNLHVMPDHAAVEMEFMSFLCGQEAEAWDRTRVKDGIQMLERQAAFLDRHLASWISNWARQVTLAGGKGIYSLTAESAHAFIIHDQDLISTLMQRLVSMPETVHPEAVDTARNS